ncbi:MAG TPA: recombinase RecQ [Chloroflexi bacterium]|nr:recombinase RecQ [Chloroflexota bacterium]
MPASTVDLQALLEQFGHTAFRPGQERVIRNLLNGRDVLAVLPTGAGKSLVYQLAAQLLPGTTIVVSPLIALMKDQVESVEECGLEAGVINSFQSKGKAKGEMRQVRHGEAKLLYVTPERFNDEGFMDQARRMEVSLFVVDEAHCISEWGHDFRPSYLVLDRVVAQLGRPSLLALTATATPWIRDEIIARLGMRHPDIVVRGVDRPNLFFEVRRVEKEEEDRRVLQHLLLDEQDENPPEPAQQLTRAMQGSGIVYTRTTKAAEETAAWLQEWGITADYYHGQRGKAGRERVQDAFMGGTLRVIAATNAFGLGVDKSDIRFVIHRDIPASIEAYYQEAGRAGRDGQFARCTIIYRHSDLGRAAFLSSSGRLTRDEVRQAREGLLANPEASWQALEEVTGLSKGDLARLITILKQDDILGEEQGRLQMLVPDFDPEAISLEGEEQRRAYERSRIEMMRGYVETDECRRRYILNYFGEEYEPERCFMCDSDVLRDGEQRVHIKEEEEGEALPPPFEMGDRVIHEKWGTGAVQAVRDDSVTVLFDKMGFKTLANGVIRERELLKIDTSR